MRLHNGPQVLFTVQMPLKSLCVECKSKQRLQGWDIVGIPEHRHTAEQTSSQEVYVETPIGLRQVYGRQRKCDHGIIMFSVSCLGQFQSVFHLLFPLFLLNSVSSSTLFYLFIALSLDLQQARTGFQRELHVRAKQDCEAWSELRVSEESGSSNRVRQSVVKATIYRSGQE